MAAVPKVLAFMAYGNVDNTSNVPPSLPRHVNINGMPVVRASTPAGHALAALLPGEYATEVAVAGSDAEVWVAHSALSSLSAMLSRYDLSGSVGDCDVAMVRPRLTIIDEVAQMVLKLNLLEVRAGSLRDLITLIHQSLPSVDFEYPVIKGPAQLIDALEVGWSAEFDLFTTFKMTALLGASTGSLAVPEKVAEKWLALGDTFYFD